LMFGNGSLADGDDDVSLQTYGKTPWTGHRSFSRSVSTKEIADLCPWFECYSCPELHVYSQRPAGPWLNIFLRKLWRLYTRIVVVWVMTPCSLVDRNQNFGGTYSFHL
jgi:hypothetical protein